MTSELAYWLILAAKGLIIGIAVSAPVGAVGVLVIRRALAYHPWNGFFAGLGGAVGDAVFAAMAGFGLTAITDTLNAWQWPLRAGGGVILLIIGVALIIHIKKTYNSPREIDKTPMRRRKAFLAARWFGAPIGVANRATQVAKRLFCRDWDPLPDPDAASRRLLAAGVPPQRSHDLS